MSAILGRINFSGAPVDRVLFQNSMNRIKSYGGDGSDKVLDGNVALGSEYSAFSRLAQQRTGLGRSRDSIIVADAILDNRAELLEALSIGREKGRYFSDGDIILHAFLKWDMDCLFRLVGDFSFAIWNAQSRKVILVRDHIGSRPLYWRLSGQTLLFGSDIQSLVEMKDLAWQIDPSAVGDFIRHPMDPMDRGFFCGLEICQPGSLVSISEAGATRRRWWHPKAANPVVFKNDDDYIEQLFELLERAVRSSVDTELPVGSHISGGIDSTVVTSMAHRSLRERNVGLKKTYCWSPEVSSKHPDLGPRDERTRICALAMQEGFEVDWLGTSVDALMELASRPIELEGTADLAAELSLLRHAENDGVRVLLSGWGGDEGFSARGHHLPAEMLRKGKLIKLARLARKASRSSGRKGQLLFLWHEAIQPFMPVWSPLAPHRKYARLNAGQFLKKELGYSSKPECTKLRLPASARDYLTTLILHGHLSARMDTWAKWASNHRIVYRYPLTSRPLVEYTSQMPTRLFMLDGHPRFPARSVAARLGLGPTSKYDIVNEQCRSSARRQFLEQYVKNAVVDSLTSYIDWENLSDSQCLPETEDVADIGRHSYELLAATRAARALASSYNST